MQSTHIFKSFTDHPSLVGGVEDIVFRMDDGGWLFLKGQENVLRRGEPIRLEYSNLGDPYRVILYLEYVPEGAKGNDSIMVSKEQGEVLSRLGVWADNDTIERLGWHGC
jgi:hypothetical protein